MKYADETTVPQLLLHKPNVQLDEAKLAELRAAGFIPVRVESFDDIKVVAATGLVPINSLWHAAMETIENNNQHPALNFGWRVAKTLKTLFMKTPEDTETPEGKTT
jgi:hypothetical protein